jgi:hypothetical protein
MPDQQQIPVAPICEKRHVCTLLQYDFCLQMQGMQGDSTDGIFEDLPQCTGKDKPMWNWFLD